MNRSSEPERIVSLVPSWTEALFELGLGSRVVGVTEYCVHPARELAHVPKVGGTKNPDLERIAGLRPDLVLANREKNKRQDVERLRGNGIEVWVTDARTVEVAARELREIAGLGATQDALRAVVDPVSRAVESARQNQRPKSDRTAVFCPIWKNPWMAIGGDTYANDLLTLCGGDNVFADFEDRSGRRYPIVKEEEIVRAAPEVILLPDEPYAFGPRDVDALRGLKIPAARSARIHLIDGTWVSWYGPRIKRAIEALKPLLASGGNESVCGRLW